MLFLSVEGFGTVDPVFDYHRNGGHGEDHDSEALVQSEEELVNEDYIVNDSCFGNKVLKVGDVFLESIVSGSIGGLCKFLNKLGKFQASGGSGVEGIEHGFKVLSELIKGFICGWDSEVCEFVVPHLSKVGSSSFTHLIQGSGYLVFI